MGLHGRAVRVPNTMYLDFQRMAADLIKRYVITDASINRIEFDQYTFDVDVRATKRDIKKLIEDHYGVTVIRVNTFRLPTKKTRIGQYIGKRGTSKRAIVTLKAGDTLFDF